MMTLSHNLWIENMHPIIFVNLPNHKTLLSTWTAVLADHGKLQEKMTNPNQLYQDMQKLDDMYEELLWHPDDELQFTHDGERIIITNTTLENKK